MAFRRAPILTTAAFALVALCGAFGAVSARAGTISVMPVRVEVAAGRRFCSLTLGNDADQPVTVQVRGFAWRRDETGADILEPAEGAGAFVVNPSIATIAPGGSRLVRCSLPAGDPAAQDERQWRLIVDQLPDPSFDAPGVVQTLLRISIPVFRAGDEAAPRLAASLVPGGVRLANPGTRHVKVLGLALRGPGGDDVAVERGFYLLAGGAQIVPAPRLPSGVSMLHVRAEEGEFDVALGPVMQ